MALEFLVFSFFHKFIYYYHYTQGAGQGPANGRGRRSAKKAGRGSAKVKSKAYWALARGGQMSCSSGGGLQALRTISSQALWCSCISRSKSRSFLPSCCKTPYKKFIISQIPPGSSFFLRLVANAEDVLDVEILNGSKLAETLRTPLWMMVKFSFTLDKKAWTDL